MKHRWALPNFRGPLARWSCPFLHSFVVRVVNVRLKRHDLRFTKLLDFGAPGYRCTAAYR